MSDDEFEERVASALRGGVPMRGGARQAIMHRVRAIPHQERPRRRPFADRSRSVRHSIVGMALAAGIGSMATLPSVLVPRGGGSAGLSTAVIGDTVTSTLHDTLRLVRLIFDDTGARRVAAVGDFNAWHVDSTPLHRDGSTRRWTATVALRDGAYRYAFVVDGVRWAIDPGVPRTRGTDGRLYSLLNLASTTN